MRRESMEDRDVVIIGGGPAGYTAAIRVMQLGGKATIVGTLSVEYV
jgi:dihydrolipoamide dehydrogenase